MKRRGSRHFTLRFQRRCNLSGINCTDLIAISADNSIANAVVCRFAAGKSRFTAFTADADYNACQLVKQLKISFSAYAARALPFCFRTKRKQKNGQGVSPFRLAASLYTPWNP
ncbi:MAG: hypothetical protein LIO46_00245, partial [Clostridiales bacterium]|nr:hypothetical protein [Clostridiales bacterium]